MRPTLFSLCAAALSVAAVNAAYAQAAPAPSGTTVTPPPATSAAPADDPDQRVRCRSIQATGSLVRRERVCRTVAEWRRIGQAGNDRARDVVGTGAVCAGGTCGNGG